jgi:ppGpp synthetase/RelA/SpoT-type nucleotidyltranferase
MMSKPQTVAEFVSWSTEATCGSFSAHSSTWYWTHQNNLWSVLQASSFLPDLDKTLSAARDSYREETGSELFALGAIPKLDWNKKTYDSLVDKLFRFNCVENPSFPDPPDKGWCRVDSAFGTINDIIRTMCFVAYADGPAFLANQIESCAAAHSLPVSVRAHAEEKGYYAHHVYVRFDVPVLSPHTGLFEQASTAVEIQIATQLQGALREVTHVLYERERLSGAGLGEWKHDFASGRFRAAYMAHSLRFIEAMIVELRASVTAQKEEQ